jgi:hypothetical protein
MEEGAMYAAKGDRLVLRGRTVGDADRDGEIVEVQGPDGAPPYLVRWADTGHLATVFPGSDAYVQHFEREEAEVIR